MTGNARKAEIWVLLGESRESGTYRNVHEESWSKPPSNYRDTIVRKGRKLAVEKRREVVRLKLNSQLDANITIRYLFTDVITRITSFCGRT